MDMDINIWIYIYMDINIYIYEQRNHLLKKKKRESTIQYTRSVSDEK